MSFSSLLLVGRLACFRQNTSSRWDFLNGRIFNDVLISPNFFCSVNESYHFCVKKNTPV